MNNTDSGKQDEITTSLEVNLPEVKILPGSPLYQIKKTWEEIRLFFARTPQEKIDFLFQVSETRLSEAVKLLKKDEPELSAQAMFEHSKTLDLITALQNQVSETAYPVSNLIENQKIKTELLTLLTGEYKIEWKK